MTYVVVKGAAKVYYFTMRAVAFWCAPYYYRAVGVAIWGEEIEKEAVALAVLGLTNVAIAEQLAVDCAGPSRDTIRRWRQEHSTEIERLREHDFYAGVLDVAQSFLVRLKKRMADNPDDEILKPGQVALLVQAAANVVHKRASLAVDEKRTKAIEDLWLLISEGAARARELTAPNVIDLPYVVYPGLPPQT